MSSISDRKAAILSRIGQIRTERSEAFSIAEALRERLDEKQSELAEKIQQLSDVTSIRDHLQSIADMTYWAELSSGASINVGDRVRYFGKTYECIQGHTKALIRSPSIPSYWQEIE